MLPSFIGTFYFHIEFQRKATVLNCCELKKLKILKRRLLLCMCYNVIGYYNVISYELIFHNEVHLAGIMEKYPNKCLQLSFFLLIFNINKAYQDLFNIRKEQMGLGEHRLQRAQPLQAGVDEQCEQGGKAPQFFKKIRYCTNAHQLNLEKKLNSSRLVHATRNIANQMKNHLRVNL